MAVKPAGELLLLLLQGPSCAGCQIQWAHLHPFHFINPSHSFADSLHVPNAAALLRCGTVGAKVQHLSSLRSAAAAAAAGPHLCRFSNSHTIMLLVTPCSGLKLHREAAAAAARAAAAAAAAGGGGGAAGT
jgi:hypothetical protein